MYCFGIGGDFGWNWNLVGGGGKSVAISIVERHGYRMAFRDFLIKGMPYMIGTVAIGTAIFLVKMMLNV